MLLTIFVDLKLSRTCRAGWGGRPGPAPISIPFSESSCRVDRSTYPVFCRATSERKVIVAQRRVLKTAKSRENLENRLISTISSVALLNNLVW